MLKTQEKRPPGKDFEVFFVDTLETTFWMGNLTQDGHNQGFLSKIKIRFSIVKTYMFEDATGSK